VCVCACWYVFFCWLVRVSRIRRREIVGSRGFSVRLWSKVPIIPSPHAYPIFLCSFAITQTPQEMTSLFSEIEMIRAFNRKFLSQLLKRLEDPNQESTLGDLLVTLVGGSVQPTRQCRMFCDPSLLFSRSLLSKCVRSFSHYLAHAHPHTHLFTPITSSSLTHSHSHSHHHSHTHTHISAHKTSSSP
jgi:hypothetical protein